MRALTGTWGLIRLILRRDRVLLPIWILVLGILPANSVAAYDKLYPTAADRLQYARTSGTNPTFLGLYGPLYGSDLGSLVAQRMGFVLTILGLINVLTVVRHTRTEEEAGRRELVGATVVGRHAGLAAALVVAMAADLVLAAIVSLGMIGRHLPVAGSLAYGLEYAVVGCVFAAVAGVAAQLSESAGGARGIAVGALGAAFVLRLGGDVGGAGNDLAWLSWLSPTGWAQRIRPYAGERWWVLLPAAALVAALVAVAVALSARRDVGAGIVRPRPGPAEAAPGLRGVTALAWRLHGPALLGWTAGFAALGVVYGGVSRSVRDLLKDNPGMERLFERLGGGSGIVDAYFAAVMSMLGLIAAGYAVQATLRMRAEETAGRAEPVLAASVPRLRWAAGHLVFTAFGPVVVVAVAGLTAGVTAGLASGHLGHDVPRVLGAALVQLPAVWLLAAIAVALFGLLPRQAALSWAVLGVAALLGLFGRAFDLDQWMLDLSPFTHVPRLPGDDLTFTPLAWLLALTALLTAAGLAGLRRRDVG